MPEAILIVNTDSPTINIPAADTILQSAQLKATQYNNIRVESNVQINTSATSTNQNITFKLKLTNPATSATTTITTWLFKPIVATGLTAGIVNQKFEYISDDRYPTSVGTNLCTGGLLSLTVTGVGADVNTQVTALNLYVTSVD